METIVIAVHRKIRPSEKLLRGVMIALAVLFLLEGILFSTGFMLPCFLMTGACFWYSYAIRREYEYVLEEGWMRIYRVSSRGRFLQHEFQLTDIQLLSRPDDPAAAPFKRGGSEKIRKFDYTSYRDDVPYYTLIVSRDGQRIKLLLDLTKEAIDRVRSANRAAVKC